jgi:O-acetyl-ADP-ribose deacetylase
MGAERRIELVRGDLVEQDVDAIVNAANAGLYPGGGVCGAIHDAAGPELWEACRSLGGCPTGSARITPGFRLRARHVIHAVGPRYTGGPTDAAQLASAYRESLRLAVRCGLKTIAFPSISTGIFGYPVDEAAGVALSAVRETLENETNEANEASRLDLVRFVLWDDRTLQAYVEAAKNRAVRG